MNLEQLLALVPAEQHEALTAFLASHAESGVNLTSVKAFLDGESVEAKTLVTSLTDSAISKGVESFKANKMQTYIDKAIAEANPAELTPEQQRIKDLELSVENMQKEKERGDLKVSAVEYCTKAGLPVELVDSLLGDNYDSTVANIDGFNSVFKAHLQKTVDEKLAGVHQPSGNGGENDGKGATENPYSTKTFNLTKQAELERDNKELAVQLRASAVVEE